MYFDTQDRQNCNLFTKYAGFFAKMATKLCGEDRIDEILADSDSDDCALGDISDDLSDIGSAQDDDPPIAIGMYVKI